jgi:hypothetical protein
MIELLPAPDHVAAYKMIGLLSEEDYDAIIAEIETKLKTHRKIAVYADMTGFTGLTLGALAKDLKYAISKLGQFGRFHRMAIVTDNPWLAGLLKMSGPLLPQMEAKSFEPREAVQALAWASED